MATHIEQDHVTLFPLDQYLRRLRYRKGQVEIAALNHASVPVQRRRVIRAVVASVGRLGGSVVPAAAPGAGEVTEPSGEAVVFVFSYDWVAELAPEPRGLQNGGCPYLGQHE